MVSYDEVLATMRAVGAPTTSVCVLVEHPRREQRLVRFEERLRNFYTKYDPSKVEGVKALLTKYKGKEEQLFTAMVKKYGPEPTAEELAPEDDDDDDDDDEEETDDERAASAKPAAKEAPEVARGEGDDEEEEEDDEGEEEEEEEEDAFVEGAPVLYCGVCGLPPEYCEFGDQYDKCVPWIKEHCPRLLEDSDGTVKGKKNAKVVRKKVVVEEKQKVVIYKEVRSKKKFVTVVLGLETVGVKLKDAAKDFGKKFACASSVKPTPQGGQEIVIQGDVIYDLPDYIEAKFNVHPGKITVKEGKGK